MIRARLDVRAKRAYDPAEDGDGYRVLIDHVWPRGVSRGRARLDDWARELAPATAMSSSANGRGTPIATLLAHIAYGAIVGGFASMAG
ncbi:MAG TPA: DUF488 family protein [Solirubrobacteraceae bacterium]|jgi:uncharacterized protein YeaO (DUF488 family)